MPTKKITQSDVTWAGGKPGAVLHVQYSGGNAGEWAGSYHVVTHGKDEKQVKAELDGIHAHHAAKEVRMNDFSTLTGKAITVRGKVWQWADCTLTERGEKAIELYLNVWDAAQKSAPGFPKTYWYGSVADVPDNNAIAQMVKTALFAVDDAEADAQLVISRLHAALPGIVTGKLGGV